jgi:hypothetical protein
MADPVSDPLQDLARMAGPANAAELFARLEEDLQTAHSGLIRAVALGDLAALRGHSHVLVALAGTAREAELHGLAIRLNQWAHEARADLPLATDPLQGLLAPMDRAVTRLIGRVQEMARELSP